MSIFVLVVVVLAVFFVRRRSQVKPEDKDLRAVVAHSPFESRKENPMRDASSTDTGGNDYVEVTK